MTKILSFVFVSAFALILSFRSAARAAEPAQYQEIEGAYLDQSGPYRLAWSYYGIPFDQNFHLRNDEERDAIEYMYRLPVSYMIVHKPSKSVLIRVPVSRDNIEVQRLSLTFNSSTSLLYLFQNDKWGATLLVVYLLSPDGRSVLNDLTDTWNSLEETLRKKLEETPRYKTIIETAGTPSITLGKAKASGLYDFSFEASAYRASTGLSGKGQLQIIGEGANRQFKILSAKVVNAAD